MVSDLPLALRQLVAIARAIAVKARLVIMDEPTTSLTRREVDNLVRVVGELQRDRVAVLFVTHKLDECYRIGGEAIVFRDGQCVAQGPIRSYTKTALGPPDDRQVARRQPLPQRPPRRRARCSSCRASACGEHFQQVSLQLAPGEVLGITGLMDSGRNELALSLAGVLPATAGAIRLGGEPIALRRPADAIRHGIGYVPEDRLAEGLFLDKPVLANIVALVLDRLRGGLGLLDRGKSRELADGLVGELQIATPNVDLPVQSLSGGNQQRVLIARWLTIGPKLLLLHGPTVGVDVGSKDTIYKVIQALAAKGMGLIVISDDLPELLQNCDRILVMRHGRLAAAFAAESASEEQLYDAMLASSAPDASPAVHHDAGRP